MKLVHGLTLIFLVSLIGATASAQTPTITSYTANGCTYTVGVSTTPCSMGPGTTLVVRGTNFGSVGGIVNTCDCPQIIVPSGNWTNTKVTGYVYSVYPNPTSGSAGIQVETIGGAWSTAVPYTPLAAQITKLTVGSCTYIPNVSSQLCVITAGTQFTVYGNYFGAGPLTSGPQMTTCNSCTNATINSWDPNWTTNPSPTGNVIVATAAQAACGNSIIVWAEGFNILGSNPVPYTTC
jgi:hypothetical protein